MEQLLTGAAWYAVLLVSLVLHEASHAWAARRGGDPTAYHGGQVSLDPRPHVRREPIGMLVVPMLSFAVGGWMFGWASTPFDPRWARAHPRRAAWMSLAGPLANLGLVLVAAAGIRLGMAAGILAAPEWIGFSTLTEAVEPGAASILATVLSILFTLNLLLFVFNLIPVPPLDGSSALGLLMDADGARRLQQWLADPRFSLLGILLAWYLIAEVFWPVHRVAVGLLYPELSYG